MTGTSKPLPFSEALPGRLFVAAETGIEPPIDSRLQELPFDKITWQNFEKLCYRLASSEADVESCRIYGDAGHDQRGIDLFARRAGREKWTVYQCKRVQDFGPSLIEAAVNEFMVGELVANTELFVLCTSESLRAPLRLDAIERMRDILIKITHCPLPAASQHSPKRATSHTSGWKAYSPSRGATELASAS